MITVEHRGYKIVFNEHADEWSCPEVNHFSSPSLLKVRAKIDSMLLSVRKKIAVKCFEIGSSHNSRWAQEKIEATIVEYEKQEIVRKYGSQETISINHLVASVAQRPGSSKASRRTAKLSELMSDTPEAHAAHDAFLVLLEEERAAARRTEAAFKAIPRVTVEDIAELHKIAKKGDDD